MSDIISQVFEYATALKMWDFAGLIFGILTVIFLIKENIWTWPFGILYVLVSLVVFTQQRLYGDLILHIFYLVLNIYGWYYWLTGAKNSDHQVPITRCTFNYSIKILIGSVIGIIIFGYLLQKVPEYFPTIPKASLPFWDATTSILSVTGMWLTAKKKIENWYYWLVVNILATGIYSYKGIYFYALLYFIYIGLAIVGYLNWKKLMASK